MTADAASAATAVTDERVRSVAADVLRRPEYARWRGHSMELIERLRAWLEHFLAWSGTLAVEQPFMYWTILLSLLAIAVALLVHVAVSVRAALTQPGSVPVKTDLHDPQFLARADSLARAGHFLEAARTVQLAAIDLLIRRRLLELARADSNRILRHRLGAATLPASERRELLQLLDRLETRWFRDRAEDRDLYEGWRRLFERLDDLPQTG